jgi:hypothetical protein
MSACLHSVVVSHSLDCLSLMCVAVEDDMEWIGDTATILSRFQSIGRLIHPQNDADMRVRTQGEFSKFDVIALGQTRETTMRISHSPPGWLLAISSALWHSPAGELSRRISARGRPV